LVRSREEHADQNARHFLGAAAQFVNLFVGHVLAVQDLAAMRDQRAIFGEFSELLTVSHVAPSEETETSSLIERKNSRKSIAESQAGAMRSPRKAGAR
jgi:hypothetical protein